MKNQNMPETQRTKALSKSAAACSRNGSMLLDDAKMLFDFERYSIALAIAILAQEEFAKAFLLQLVVEGALPWIPEVRKSMARHQCKHLLCMVMEWLPAFDWDLLKEQREHRSERHAKKMAWLERRLERYRQKEFEPNVNDPEPVEESFTFPAEVSDALNIFRHEEIERLRFGYAWKEDEWSMGKARKTADGQIDKKKQSALYVDITKTGEVGLHPGLITCQDAAAAIALAVNLSEDRVTCSDEYTKLKEILPLVFENLVVDQQSGSSPNSQD